MAHFAARPTHVTEHSPGASVVRAIVAAVRDGAHLLGPGVIPGLNALLLGYLMYRSRLVPRVLPAMALVGAPVFLVAASASLLGLNEQGSVLSAIGFLPVALWEPSLGLWLTFKGFNRSAPILSTPADEWASADTSAAAVPPSTAVAAKAAAV